MTSKLVLRRGIDWDKARGILAQVGGKKPEIGKIKHLFRSRGVYGSEVIEEMENDLVRIIVRKLNGEAKAEGRFDDQFFNFVEVLDDGTKKQYYERFADAEPEACAWLVQSEFRKGLRQIRKAYEIHDRSVDRFGRRYEQIVMEFMRTVPARPEGADDDE